MERFTFNDWLTIPTYDDPSQMVTPELDFDPSKCKQCGVCVSICPGGCLVTDSLTKRDFMDGGKPRVKDSGVPRLDTVKPGVSLCIACFDCGTACPEGAISLKTHFNPGFFFKRITQTSDMRYPKKY